MNFTNQLDVCHKNSDLWTPQSCEFQKSQERATQQHVNMSAMMKQRQRATHSRNGLPLTCSTPPTGGGWCNKIWGRVTMQPSAQPGEQDLHSLAMLKPHAIMKIPITTTDAEGLRYLSPLSMLWGTREPDHNATVTRMDTRVNTTTGPVGDSYETVYQMHVHQRPYCVVVSSGKKAKAQDWQLIQGCRIETESWFEDPPCYLCKADTANARVVQCDHCGREAHTDCVKMPFDKASLDQMDIVEMRCTDCATRAATVDMMALLVSPSSIGENMIFTVTPLYSGNGIASNTGLSLIRHLELQTDGQAPPIGSVDNCLLRLVDRIWQQQQWHRARGKVVLDHKLENWLLDQHGEWWMCDLGAIVQNDADVWNATYCGFMARDVMKTQDIELHENAFRFSPLQDLAADSKRRELLYDLLTHISLTSMAAMLLFRFDELGFMSIDVESFEEKDIPRLQTYATQLVTDPRLQQDGVLYATAQVYRTSLAKTFKLMLSCLNQPLNGGDYSRPKRVLEAIQSELFEDGCSDSYTSQAAQVDDDPDTQAAQLNDDPDTQAGQIDDGPDTQPAQMDDDPEQGCP